MWISGIPYEMGVMNISSMKQFCFGNLTNKNYIFYKILNYM